MTWQIALVGIGKIARDQHIPAIAKNSEITLAATASRNSRVDGIAAYPDLKTLLEAQAEISCVSLCTPPQARFSDARLALEAGRHVMLEKPPGATLSEVRTLIDIAADQGLSLFATWHSRHAAAVEPARQWLSGKSIRRVDIIWKEDVRRWHPGQEWIWEPGGLGVFDPGINALSVMTAILPRPVHLSAATLSFPENRHTPIAADLSFVDPGGASVSAIFDWRQEGPQSWDIRIETNAGSAVLSDGGACLTVDGEQLATGPDREYPALYDRFVHLLETGQYDVDLSPMRHVADAFTIGRRIRVDPFHF